ncbi:MAG: methyltransferase domain-containing protein [Legionellaceae bacterium]|nr:methyltransferase domain-containing protein [Legionellaceae bacterium]
MTVTSVNLDEQRHRYRALDDWFKTPQGHYLGAAFLMQFSQCSTYLEREAVLQLGLCGENLWLSDSAFKKMWLATPCLNIPTASFITSLTHLPLCRNSVDVVIVPMMLEIFGRYKSPLDEIDRILKPMGHVIFLGINPVSLWGASLACQGLSTLGQAGLRPHSPLVLKRAFLNRGYEQKRFETFYYVPPITCEKWIKNSLFLNEMGKMMSLFPAGFYCMAMQKYQKLPLTTKLRTRREPLFLPG